jgi:hypothetical protein
MENQVEVKETTEMQLMPQSDTELERSIANAERYLELQDRMRKLAIKVTNQEDWIDQMGNPYLEISGSTKIADAYGVSCNELCFEQVNIKDDKGSYYVFYCRAILSWKGRSLPEEGAASSRDQFFAKRTVYENKEKKQILLPQEEINITDIRKKAKTNMLNRGIKNLLGLSYTWEEIEKYSEGKITRAKASSVTYDKGSKGGNEDTDKDKETRQKMGKMLMEMSGDDKENASTLLELMTKWTTKEGKEVAGKKSIKDVSTKSLNITKDKIKKRYLEWCKENSVEPMENL